FKICIAIEMLLSLSWPGTISHGAVDAKAIDALWIVPAAGSITSWIELIENPPMDAKFAGIMEAMPLPPRSLVRSPKSGSATFGLAVIDQVPAESGSPIATTIFVLPEEPNAKVPVAFPVGVRLPCASRAIERAKEIALRLTTPGMMSHARLALELLATTRLTFLYALRSDVSCTANAVRPSAEKFLMGSGTILRKGTSAKNAVMWAKVRGEPGTMPMVNGRTPSATCTVSVTRDATRPCA